MQTDAQWAPLREGFFSELACLKTRPKCPIISVNG